MVFESAVRNSENLTKWSFKVTYNIVAPRCDDPKLIIRVINFELVQLICPRYLNVTDVQTDDLLSQYRALHYMHRAVKIIYLSLVFF